MAMSCGATTGLADACCVRSQPQVQQEQAVCLGAMLKARPRLHAVRSQTTKGPFPRGSFLDRHVGVGAKGGIKASKQDWVCNGLVCCDDPLGGHATTWQVNASPNIVPVHQPCARRRGAASPLSQRPR